MTDQIDWVALCAAGAVLCIRPDECDRDGCTRPLGHGARHSTTQHPADGVLSFAEWKAKGSDV